MAPVRSDRGKGGAVDVSIVALAATASVNDVRTRYEAARATLGSMTGEWDARAGGKSERGAAGDGPAAALERRRAMAERTGVKASGLGQNPHDTLRRRSRELGTDLSEAVAAASEVTAARRRAMEELRASGSSRQASQEQKRALKQAEEALKQAEAAEVKVKTEEAKSKAVGEATAAKAKRDADKVKKDAQKPAAPAKESVKRSNPSSSSNGDAGFVIELCKFVFPAVAAWLARQAKINKLGKNLDKLNQNLDEMTQAKCRAALEATKLRSQVVDLRKELGLAKDAANDSKQSAEQMMMRKNAQKEVKMKQMAIDHAEMLNKVRAEAAKEVTEAKALEVGARWREEACRRIKNRAEERAEDLEKQVAELERKIKNLENTRQAEQADNVKRAVQNAAGGVGQFIRAASLKVRGGHDEPTPAARPAPAPVKQQPAAPETAPAEQPAVSKPPSATVKPAPAPAPASPPRRGKKKGRK